MILVFVFDTIPVYSGLTTSSDRIAEVYLRNGMDHSMHVWNDERHRSDPLTEMKRKRIVLGSLQRGLRLAWSRCR